MRISMGYINAFMYRTIRNRDSREAHIGHQADMTMSDPVAPYLFHSAGSTTTAHFVEQISFCKTY